MNAVESRTRYFCVGMRRLAKSTVALVLAFVLLVFLIWASTAVYFSPLTWPRRDFSISEWSEVYSTGNRYQLCSSLLSSGTFLEASRLRVEAALGQPDFEVGSNFFVYEVKETSLLGFVVSHRLIIEFDSRNTVSRVFLDSDLRW